LTNETKTPVLVGPWEKVALKEGASSPTTKKAEKSLRDYLANQPPLSDSTSNTTSIGSGEKVTISLVSESGVVKRLSLSLEGNYLHIRALGERPFHTTLALKYL